MSAATPDKLIISNYDQLKLKYKAAGVSAVDRAVKRLIKADATRGITTIIIDLSDAPAMAAFGASPISAGSAGDAKLNKQVIDKVFASYETRPAYMMLLGSTDVIPHVPLDNPMAGDGDTDVPSDLPYACDQAYSTDVQDFIAPSRVVGRLPNVTGDSDPAYLVGLLDNAATYKDRSSADYGRFLGISAQVWEKSSELSLDAVFGTHSGMKVSPPDGYKWSAADAKHLSHFVNCHGAAADPNFYGQKGGSYPVAHSAAWMAGKVAEATIMAAECCYGAELYNPALPTAAGQAGMCNTYLGRKAYAYFGSTNIAYGPDTTNDQADLMCQYFLAGVLGGASAGRACLKARLEYVRNKSGVLTPTDLKTIAQFNLMADPSLTPVAAQLPLAVIPSTAGTKNLHAAAAAVSRHGRFRRRATLRATAEVTTAYRLGEPAAPPGGGKTGRFGKLRQLAAENGIKQPDLILSYSVGEASNTFRGKGFALATVPHGLGPKAVHVILERREPPDVQPQLVLIRGLEAVEYENGMVAQVFESR